jgi:hypothetical protein
MSSSERPPTEEELRAAYEEQLRKITVGDVLIQTAVSLVNLAGRRLGLAPGAEGERDLEQVRDAIDGVRGLLPVLERAGGADALKPLREALSQLQLEYARLAKEAPGEVRPEAAEETKQAEGPGPAQSSGRLWVPGS